MNRALMDRLEDERQALLQRSHSNDRPQTPPQLPANFGQGVAYEHMMPQERPQPQPAERTATLRVGDIEWLAWCIVRLCDYSLSPTVVDDCGPHHRAVAIRDLNALRSAAITLSALSRAPGDNA